MIPLVLFTALLCNIEGAGIGDTCQEIEVRAASCQQAAQWARAWMPPKHVLVFGQCIEQRMASR